MPIAMVEGLRSALPRPSRARPGGRSARVVSDVLNAATREFARLGYEAMRVEDVATIAGVNKTTVYRRWPTKADLVAAALRHSSFDLSFSPDTGTVRNDLLAMLDAYVTHTRDPLWRGVIRAMMVDIPSPELARLLGMFRAEYRERWTRVVQRGIERNELPKGTSAPLVSEMVLSTMAMRKLRNEETITSRVRQAIVDIVLAGARAGAAILDRPQAKKKGRAKKTSPKPVVAQKQPARAEVANLKRNSLLLEPGREATRKSARK